MTKEARGIESAERHIPVLLDAVLTALAPAPGETYIDGTFGAGGYSRAILNAADCRLVAIDRDPDAARRAVAFKDQFKERFTFIQGPFSQMTDLVASIGMEQVDGVVLDIGVSSFQLDEAERGFSFQASGPLDMRMSKDGETAADVVNTYDQSELADILYHYGEEPKSRQIAAAIVKERAISPFETTTDLASLIEKTVGMPRRRPGKKTIHPATRSFMALRIHVNDELGELERYRIV